MFIRQKVILGMLTRVEQPLQLTPFVKLMFLLRHETSLRHSRTFYDFVPYKFGPFSFALYREMNVLRRNGYIATGNDRIALVSATRDLTSKAVAELPYDIREAIDIILSKYSTMAPHEILRYVYSEYPWYAINSQLVELLPATIPPWGPAPVAIYTIGYEGKSVDEFFNTILRTGIDVICDVRANPVSRSSGFSSGPLQMVAEKLSIAYEHVPELGIRSSERKGLTTRDSYDRLLNDYEQHTLPHKWDHIDRLCLLAKSRTSVLVCLEGDPQMCHRSRLAVALSTASNLPVVHLR